MRREGMRLVMREELERRGIGEGSRDISGMKG
jgi:hypothetical protein